MADAIVCFDKRFSSYEEAQTAYEVFIKEEDLEQHINESELFIRKNRKQRIEAASLLEQLTPSADPSDPDDSICCYCWFSIQSVQFKTAFITKDQFTHIQWRIHGMGEFL